MSGESGWVTKLSWYSSGLGELVAFTGGRQARTVAGAFRWSCSAMSGVASVLRFGFRLACNDKLRTGADAGNPTV